MLKLRFPDGEINTLTSIYAPNNAKEILFEIF